MIVTKNGVEYEIKIRKLTEVETMILMGMRAEEAEKCKAVGVSKTQLYKQSGNGLVTNCITLLLDHLYKAQYDPSYECGDEKILREQAEGNFTRVATV